MGVKKYKNFSHVAKNGMCGIKIMMAMEEKTDFRKELQKNGIKVRSHYRQNLKV